MIARTPEANLAEAMNHLQGEVSREIGRSGHRINKIFGAPYGRSLLSTTSYFLSAYKYAYRNPVDARMIDRVEAYPYSTLHGLLGFSQLIIPVEFDETLFSSVEGTLQWLNEGYPNNDYRKAVGRAMRRAEFKLAKKFEIKT